jgi:hypothetical protein
MLSREEHRMKELSLSRGGKRSPRRSQTQYEYQLPMPPAMTIRTTRHYPQITEDIPDRPSVSTVERSQPSPPAPLPVKEQYGTRRPPLGSPRRSYSVMDCEPEPNIHRLSTRMTLVDLPPELHYAIFDFLDPIDSTCLGLTNRHFYQIHRRMHGTITLSTRRDGPNELEWAWHLAGVVMQRSDRLTAPTITSAHTLGDKAGVQNALSRLRVRGQAYCRKCGITRCELHKHIQDWMGDTFEYCLVKQKFGPVAPEGARPYCYMSKPDDPHRCGRHRSHKSKVVLK